MTSHPYAQTKLEQLLRDACRRAVRLDLTFADQLRLCRSVIALAREVRLRFGGLAPRIGDPPLASLLATVCDRVCDLGLDPTLPLPDALLLQRVATGLSRAVRLAEKRIGTKKLIQREDVPDAPPREDPTHRVPETIGEDAMYRDEAPNPDPSEVSPEMVSAKKPIHRERVRLNDDDRLSAWRQHHTTDRDQRAHELLRTVLDERVLNKIRAMNRRERDEAAALAADEGGDGFGSASIMASPGAASTDRGRALAVLDRLDVSDRMGAS